MKEFKQIEDLLAKAKVDAVAFEEKGNKTAGTRLRGYMQEIKTLAQEVRTKVQEKKNS